MYSSNESYQKHLVIPFKRIAQSLLLKIHLKYHRTLLKNIEEVLNKQLTCSCVRRCYLEGCATCPYLSVNWPQSFPKRQQRAVLRNNKLILIFIRKTKCIRRAKENLKKRKKEDMPSVQFSSVTQSCPTLWDPMNWSTPGLPVHHQLPEFTQIHVHRVCDAIQPSHPLSSPSPPAPNPSQHQSLFQWVNPSHEVAKVLEFQL